MHLIYIDDSKDERLSVFSGLAVPAVRWREVFDRIKLYRQHLRDQYGISIYYELHATKFVKGRGSLGAERVVEFVRISAAVPKLSSPPKPNVSEFNHPRPLN